MRILVVSFLCFYFPTFIFGVVEKTCNILSIGVGGSYAPVYIAMLEKYGLPKYDLFAGISIGASITGILSYHNHNLSEGIDLLKREIMFNPELTQNRFIKYQSFPKMIRKRSLVDNDFVKIHETVLSKIRNSTIATPSIIGSVHKSSHTFRVFDISKYNGNQQAQMEIFLSTISIQHVYPATKVSVHDGPDNEYIDGGSLRTFIVEDIENHIHCDFYNITLFSAIQLGRTRYSLRSHYLHYFMNNYLYVHYLKMFLDGVLVEVGKPCTNNRKNGGAIKGHVHLCTINYPEIDKYSPMDFRHNRELYDIGLQYSECKTYNYCGK